MAPRLVVLGWDSATFDVIDPLLQQGRLPAFAEVVERGFRAGLRSTWPPMTDCAWTSAFTGRNPGGHGIFGSWYRAPGAYACRYFSSRDRRAAALWELTDEVRFLVWNVPMTFPPTELHGAMVAGYGAPPGSRFCNPGELQEELAARWAMADLLDRAPHRSLEAFRHDLVRGLEAQADALPWAARATGTDCVVAVWPHIDRAQHFFWRFRGTTHPLADAVDQVYEAMDAATASVMRSFPDADVVIVSDHGAGRLNGDVNLSAWLSQRGYAQHANGRRGGAAALAWKVPRSIRRFAKRVAPSLARRTVGAALTSQLGPFDWSRTKAFLGFQGDLWLNLEGRESQGCVRRADAEPLLDEISERLLSLCDPSSGAQLFCAAHRGRDIYSGVAADLAPDVILDSWSAGYRVAPSRESGELVTSPLSLAGVDEAWSADHRPVGIFAAAGPRIAPGRADELSLYDVCPTALALLDQPVPANLDGCVPEEVLDEDWRRAHPVRTRGATEQRTTRGEYSEEEAAAVASHLKDLGYIE